MLQLRIASWLGQDENNNDNNEDFYFKPLEFVSSKIKSISATSHLSILYSFSNELIILDQYKTPIVYTVLVLPSGMELNSLFSNAYRAEYFTAFVTKENKIYVHKKNYELPYDMDFQVGDYVKLNDSFLSNTLNLPNLKIIGMDYSNIYVIYTDYLINEDIVDDNKNLNLFFIKLYNQLLDSKNSFIDFEFVNRSIFLTWRGIKTVEEKAGHENKLVKYHNKKESISQ
ncbi:hypothetical protein ABK040_012414 [Willaertia magna]